MRGGRAVGIGSCLQRLSGQKEEICDPEARMEVCFEEEVSASAKETCYGIFLNTNLSQVIVVESRNVRIWS